MKLLRAEHLGMCFGVRDAIQLAREHAALGPVTVLGQLVHNQRVVDDLRHVGIEFTEDPQLATAPTLLITAHGASQKRITAARDTGRPVIETTCPLVHAAHQALAKLVKDGFHPVVIGQRGHVEVRGMTEDLAECDVVLSEADIDSIAPRERFGVVSQTTQPIERVRQLVAHLRARFSQAEIRFRDTVCQPTKLRQHAAEDLARRSDVVIVVGGANSNNTRQLVATCERFCPRVHHVQSADQLRLEWIAEAETVGLTAGTSTPDDLIEEVASALMALGEAISRTTSIRAEVAGG